MNLDRITRRAALKVVGATGVIAAGTGLVSAHGGGVDPRALNELRQATAAYHDPANAIEDGYRRDDHCVEEPSGDAAMGYHYLNFDLIDDEVERTEPEALVYERRGREDHLVAAEFLSAAAPEGPPPSVFGHDMHPAPFLPFANWELHVWCWKPNPRGLFADFNPRVECPR